MCVLWASMLYCVISKKRLVMKYIFIVNLFGDINVDIFYFLLYDDTNRFLANQILVLLARLRNPRDHIDRSLRVGPAIHRGGGMGRDDLPIGARSRWILSRTNKDQTEFRLARATAEQE
jgi:hypothetical protein